MALDHFMRGRLDRVAPLTVARDLSALRWAVLRFASPQVQPTWLALLADLSKALRTRNANVPVTKALPLRQTDVDAICTKLRATRATRAALLLRLAWRTASRVAEVAELTTDCLTLQDNLLTITFLSSKTNKDGKTRLDHRVVLRNPADLAALVPTKRRRPTTLFTAKHVKCLCDHLANHPVDLSWKQQVQTAEPHVRHRHRYSRHSIKRGAAWVLVTEAAQGRVPLHVVQQLLKHKHQDSIVGYAGNPQMVALASRVDSATSLLH